MADVFISYSTGKADNTVQQIADALDRAGISCWYMGRDSTHGRYGAQITKAIRECAVFLLVLNEKSNNSDDVIKELCVAFRYKKEILPFHVDDCDLSDDLIYHLSAYTIIKANPPDKSSIRKLIKVIVSILGKEARSKMPEQTTRTLTKTTPDVFISYHMEQTPSTWAKTVADIFAAYQKEMPALQTSAKTVAEFFAAYQEEMLALQTSAKTAADIFISYRVSEEMSPLVRNIADKLESENISCWYAPRNTKPSAFAPSILNAIRTCKVFLLMLDEGANGPGYVYNELVEAYALHKSEKKPHIIPFKLGDFPINLELYFYLRPFYIMNGGNSPNNADTDELIQKISNALNQTPETNSPGK